MPSSLVTGAVKGLLNISKKLTVKKGAVIVFESGTTEPASPVKGTVYFDSTANVLKLWNGTVWVNL